MAIVKFIKVFVNVFKISIQDFSCWMNPIFVSSQIVGRIIFIFFNCFSKIEEKNTLVGIVNQKQNLFPMSSVSTTTSLTLLLFEIFWIFM